MPDKLLTKRHEELLNKRETIIETEFDHESGQYVKKYRVTDQPETQAVSKGLELAYKIKKKFPQSPGVVVPVQINFKDKELE